MPFNSSDDLQPDPDIRIFIVGQLILQPLAAARGCEIFVNRSAADHTLSVEVRKRRPGKPDEIVMRHLGELPLAQVPPRVPPQNGMFIRVLSVAPEVKAYNGNVSSREGETLGLVLNMQNIHDVSVGQVEAIGGRPSIVIENGTFYTADTYPEGSIKKRRPNSTPKPLGRFASIIGVNIYLANAQQRAAIIWKPDGRDVSLTFPKVAGQSHEIYICNEPQFQDDDPQAPFKHDEFAEYYKILPAIPKDEQYELITPPPSRGSLRTPCMSVLLNTQ